MPPFGAPGIVVTASVTFAAGMAPSARKVAFRARKSAGFPARQRYALVNFERLSSRPIEHSFKLDYCPSV